MDELDAALAGIGAVMLVLGATSGLIDNRWHVSEPLVALLAGVAMGPIVHAFGPSVHYYAMLHEASRLTLGVALVATAVRLPPGFFRKRWRSVALLLGVAMPSMWLVSSALGALVLDWSLPAAVLLGAILSPTDPVIASAIVTAKIARERVPARLRHVLSAEAGSNDALAYPLVLLPMMFLDSGSDGVLAEWSIQVLVRGLALGALAGALVGWATARSVLWVRTRLESEPIFHLSVTVAMAAFLLGGLELVGANDLLGVFVAGLVFKNITRDDPEVGGERVHAVIERLLLLPVFVLFGALLPLDGWRRLGWPGVAFVVAVLLLRRLPLMLLLHHVVPAIRGRREARFAGWFGPIGVAALYYASLSAERLQRHDFFIVGSLVVASSVVTHGVTATRLVQRRERIEPAEAPNGDHRPQSESA